MMNSTQLTMSECTCCIYSFTSINQLQDRLISNNKFTKLNTCDNSENKIKPKSISPVEEL